jgi:spermidine synthase
VAVRGRTLSVLAMTVVLSACSLMYELLIAQTLSLSAGNTVVWYSLSVGIYIGGMGIGALLCRRRFGARPWRTLFFVELSLSVVGAAAVPTILLAHSLYLYFSATPREISVFVFFGVSFAMLLGVGVLSGIELPTLIRLGNATVADGEVTNRVLGWDYIGSMLAGLSFPLALLPFFNLTVIGFGTAAVNLAVGALILRRFVAPDERTGGRSWATAGVAAVLLLGIVQSGSIEQYFLKRYYFYTDAAERGSLFGALGDLPDVYRAYSPYQQIDLLHDPAGFRGDVLLDAYSTKFRDAPATPTNRILYLNGDFQLGSSYEELYHEWFAHIPIMLRGAVPRDVLVLGAGDGMLIRELVKHDEVRRILHVDLDRALVELAKTDPVLTALNRNALDDQRVETRYGDAFQFVRTSTETFDAIYMDFPFAKDYNLAKLYSREFFHFLKSRLRDGAYAVFDAPGGDYLAGTDGNGDSVLVPFDEWDVYYNTLRSAGFDTIMPFYTQLEEDNPRAFEILESWPGVPTFVEIPDPETRSTARRMWMEALISSHVESFQQGFISVWKDPTSLAPPAYNDFGADFYILNAPRFELALLPPFASTAAIDPSKVNSILRPTLPMIDVWSVRSR